MPPLHSYLVGDCPLTPSPRESTCLSQVGCVWRLFPVALTSDLYTFMLIHTPVLLRTEAVVKSEGLPPQGPYTPTPEVASLGGFYFHFLSCIFDGKFCTLTLHSCIYFFICPF